MSTFFVAATALLITVLQLTVVSPVYAQDSLSLSLTEEAHAQEESEAVSSRLRDYGCFLLGGVLCPAGSTIAKKIGSQATQGAVIITASLISAFGYVGIWLIDIAGNLLGWLATQSRFISNEVVRAGWPFVQGLANLGFIFALLAIAGATALRLDIGGGVRRLLPRLLIAAVLLNFSLVIGGILIDSSRLMMAVMSRSMGAGSPSTIGARILDRSHIVDQVFKVQTGADGAIRDFSIREQSSAAYTWEPVVNAAKSTIFVWGLMIAMVYISAQFLVRYVILLFLLVISPLAYLAVALPGAGDTAKKWWSQFLKWTFYGPVAFFILLLAAVLPSSARSGVVSAGEALLSDITDFLLVVGLLFLAGKAGSLIGAAGAAATIGFVNKSGGYARRNPKKVGAAGALALGGVPLLAGAAAGYGVGKWGKKAAGNAYRDFSSGAKPMIRNIAKKTPVAKWFVPKKRDDKGNLKPGQSTLASTAAWNLRLKMDPKVKEAVRKVETLGDIRANIAADSDYLQSNPDAKERLNSAQLAKPEVLHAIKPDGAIAIAEHSESPGQVQAIVRQKYSINSWGDEDQRRLVEAIDNNGNLNRSQKERFIKQLLDGFDEG